MQSDLLFSCAVQKKNTKQQRILELYPNLLIISINEKQDEISTGKVDTRMFYLNNLDTQIQWNYSNNRLLGFSIFYASRKFQKGKIKTYFSDSETLSKLKQVMSGKAIYLKIDNQYQFLKVIENKQRTNIFECQCKITNQIKVAKKIPIGNSGPLSQEQMRVQMAINTKPHKYLLKVDEIFLEDNHLIYIMNYCKGGTLYHYLSNRNFSLDFGTAIKITKKILKGLEHLHSLGILHRDIKLDNIMFDEENNINTLKIIDFEFSTFSVEKSQLICGTPGYIAPEILNGEEVCLKSDIYSVGCIFYALLTGNKLYPTDASKQNILSLNKQNKFKLSNKVFHTKAYEVLLQMLIRDRAQRPTARELLNLELFQDKFQRNERLTLNIKRLEFPQFKNPFQSQIIQHL